tara:strand:- start:876 stop:1091 length:216 start_codon:yes stop_codon:yes gene_type:complete
MADLITKFKSIRKDKDMTQKEVSDNTGVSVITVYTWESRTRQPTLDNFERVLNKMGYQLTIQPLELTSELR